MHYKISELSMLLNVSTNTIRRYESMGYIISKRSEHSNYRYYSEEDLATFTNVRLLRKYGFSHPEIRKMKSSDMVGLVSVYEKRLQQFDEQIRYLTQLRHRLKDDVVLMKKAIDFNDSCYIRESVAFSYVLYQSGESLLTEPERLQTIQNYLYVSPEVQRIYLIRKKDVDQGRFTLHAGWAIKADHVERYSMHENDYTERYERRESLVSIAKLPVQADKDVKEELLRKPFEYMQEQQLTIAGDIIGIVIANVTEDGQDMQHVLVSVPIAQM